MSECQTAWIRMRRRVTRRHIRIQAVCIWDYGRDRQDKIQVRISHIIWFITLFKCSQWTCQSLFNTLGYILQHLNQDIIASTKPLKKAIKEIRIYLCKTHTQTKLNRHLLKFSKWFNLSQCWWKCCLSVKQLGFGWDAELLGVSSGSKLFTYGTLVVLCRQGLSSHLSEISKCDYVMVEYDKFYCT